MLYVLIGLIILACIILWAIILLQNPKGGGLSQQFGGGSVTNIIGAKQSTDFVEKATWIIGSVIFGLILLTSFITTDRGAGIDDSDLRDRADEEVVNPSPAAGQGGGVPAGGGAAPAGGNPAPAGATPVQPQGGDGDPPPAQGE